MVETRFLPPLIPSKWRGLRGLAVRLRELTRRAARTAVALEGRGPRAGSGVHVGAIRRLRHGGHGVELAAGVPGQQPIPRH